MFFQVRNYVWSCFLELSVRLSPVDAFVFARFFFFFHAFWDKFYRAWTVAAKFDLSNYFQPISAHRALFTDPQILFFNNIFIKNTSHGTIHTFKNYFVAVFFSFQFLTVSRRTLSVTRKDIEELLIPLLLLVCLIFPFRDHNDYV